MKYDCPAEQARDVGRARRIELRRAHEERRLKRLDDLGRERRVVARDLVEAPEPEPRAIETGDATREPRVLRHALELGPHAGGVDEPVARSGCEERVVGHRVPQEVREPARQLVRLSARTWPIGSPGSGCAIWYRKSGDCSRPAKNHSSPIAKSFSFTPASNSV